MPSPSRQVTYRLRARPGDDRKYRIIIQRRRWFFFWSDWYPVDNAVRALQHEFIEHYERMQEILQELKDAESWVSSTYKLVDLGDKRNGISAPFKDEARAQEVLMPDASTRYREVQALVTESQGRHRPEGGTRTLLVGPTGKRFDVSSLNREKLGEEFNADHVMVYRPPQQDNKRDSKGHGHQHNQQRQDKPS